MNENYDEQDFENAQQIVTARQRFFRKPKQAADLLSNLMARKGYAQVESQTALIQAWNEIIEPTLRTKTQVARVKSGVLEIVVSSAAINQQLTFQKANLLKQIQQRWSEKIKDLRFKVGVVDLGQ